MRIQEDRLMQMDLSQNSSICNITPLIAGPRWYVDASTTPDGSPDDTRSAGLGIFFLDPISPLRCYTKAKTNQITSVLVAESAALALAAMICSRLRVSEISFLTDNQTLANFLNGADYDLPPHWGVKPFTQSFQNVTTGCNWKTFKIHRQSNVTAHVLATQALGTLWGEDVMHKYLVPTQAMYKAVLFVRHWTM